MHMEVAADAAPQRLSDQQARRLPPPPPPPAAAAASPHLPGALPCLTPCLPQLPTMGKVSKKTKKFIAKGHLGAAIRQRKSSQKVKRARAAQDAARGEPRRWALMCSRVLLQDPACIARSSEGLPGAARASRMNAPAHAPADARRPAGAESSDDDEQQQGAPRKALEDMSVDEFMAGGFLQAAAPPKGRAGKAAAGTAAAAAEEEEEDEEDSGACGRVPVLQWYLQAAGRCGLVMLTAQLSPGSSMPTRALS